MHYLNQSVRRSLLYFRLLTTTQKHKHDLQQLVYLWIIHSKQNTESSGKFPTRIMKHRKIEITQTTNLSTNSRKVPLSCRRRAVEHCMGGIWESLQWAVDQDDASHWCTCCCCLETTTITSRTGRSSAVFARHLSLYLLAPRFGQISHNEKKRCQHCEASATIYTTRPQRKRATQAYLIKRHGDSNVDGGLQVRLEEDRGGSTRQNWIETVV